ncbi:hypothetical protein OC842_005222, partial [Tilletia horrida]
MNAVNSRSSLKATTADDLAAPMGRRGDSETAWNEDEDGGGSAAAAAGGRGSRFSIKDGV